MEKENLWKSALAQIQLDISEPNFKTWFKKTSISEIKDNKAIISVPSNFVKSWIKKKYHKKILKSLKNVNSNIEDIDYIILANNTDEKKEAIKVENNNHPQMEFQELSLDPETGLNPKYTFDNFVIGPFNELAHAAGFAVSDNPGFVYNPLFIYSKTGLGKTHLLQAIGNKINKNKEKKVLYIPAQKFISEIISAIRGNKMDDFKYKYKDIDVFIIDDIQFLSGKEKTQEEFFHTFNELYEKNKQIILSSDRHPKSISALTDRLRSRFEGGMIADIGCPDTETRAAILKAKAKEKGFSFPDNVYYYIADNVKKNIRELEGVLNKIIIQQQITKKNINIEDVKLIIKNINQISSSSLSFSKLIKTVSDFYDVNEKDITGKSRKREIVKSRQIIIYILRKNLNYSFPYIAKKIGGKDHTTIMYSFSKIENEVKKNNDIKEEISYIEESLTTT